MALLKDLEHSKEFNVDKNSSLDFETISAFSHKSAWWIGECGHEWESVIYNKSKSNSSCPYCSGKRILKGFNDLVTINPKLATQWHPTKNSTKPELMFPNSNKKAWWICEKGHEWEAVIYSRHANGRGCPLCSGSRPVDGETDLASLNPELASQWHPTKNGILQPNMVTVKSSKKVWWLGKCGHEWEAFINNRSRNNASCPYCSGHKVLKGFNDITTTHLEIAKQWNPIRNHIDINKISKGSDINAWWMCSKKHEWQANVSIRTSQDTGCPTCSNRKIIQGFNDLKTSNPIVASDWNKAKNGKLTSEMVSEYSNKKVWWKCQSGHEWQAFVYARVNAGCRKCTAGLKSSKGEKEIKTFLKELGLNVSQSNYDLLKGNEIDLYSEKQNLAVEFNGLYWHTEAKGKNDRYHYDKWITCKRQGIDLTHIWEDDWNNKCQAVKNLLKAKVEIKLETLNYSKDYKIEEVTVKQAEIFFNENHIDGFTNCENHIGLYIEGDLKAAISFTDPNKYSESDILRFVSIENANESLNILLEYLSKEFNILKVKIIEDNGTGFLRLYESNGFTILNTIKPSYSYLVNGLRKKEANGLRDKIWDAGKTVLVKEL